MGFRLPLRITNSKATGAGSLLTTAPMAHLAQKRLSVDSGPEIKLGAKCD